MTERFITRAKLIHGNKYDYSATIYTLSRDKLKIICREHGEFEQTADNHLQGHGCKKCVNKATGERQRLTSDEFIKNAKLVHRDKFNYSKAIYVTGKIKITIICPEHGEFEQTPNNHLASKFGCTQCGLERDRSSTDEFIETAIKIHGDRYEYSRVNYVNSRTEVIITCKRHGDFEQQASRHLSGSGCQKCAQVGYSLSSIKWLKYIEKKEKVKIQHAENGGEYIISNSNYRADGYDKENNTIYEFNGCLYHGCPKCFDKDDINPVTKQSNKELYQKTLLKEDFIRSQGYTLVTIWGHEWRSIKREAENFLSRPKFVIKLKKLNN